MWQVTIDKTTKMPVYPFRSDVAIEARLAALEAKLSAMETKLAEATSVCRCTNRLNGLQEAIEALGRQIATLRAER